MLQQINYESPPQKEELKVPYSMSIASVLSRLIRSPARGAGRAAPGSRPAQRSRSWPNQAEDVACCRHLDRKLRSEQTLECSPTSNLAVRSCCWRSMAWMKRRPPLEGGLIKGKIRQRQRSSTCCVVVPSSSVLMPLSACARAFTVNFTKTIAQVWNLEALERIT